MQPTTWIDFYEYCYWEDEVVVRRPVRCVVEAVPVPDYRDHVRRRVLEEVVDG